MVGAAWCGKQCCKPGEGPSEDDVKRLIFDECVFIDKQKLLDLVDQLKKWADNLGLGKLGTCLALCLAEPPGLREGCVVGCIADYFAPGSGNVLEFYHRLFDAFPMIGPECCAKIANRLRDQYDVNWDLSEGCCSTNYYLIALSMNDFDRWMREYWCCYYCSDELFENLPGYAVSRIKFSEQLHGD